MCLDGHDLSLCQRCTAPDHKNLDYRTDVYDSNLVKGSEFIKRIQQIGKNRGVPVRFMAHQGKGSHGRLYYGEHFTTIKDRKKEIGAGLVRAMLIQLGLKSGDIQ